MKSNLIGLLMLSAVVACAPVGENVARDTAGKVLGQTAWKEIHMSDSRLQMAGGSDLVESIKHMKLADRYLEEWDLGYDGQLNYEQTSGYNAGYRESTGSKRTFARSLSAGLEEYAVEVKAADIQNQGRLQYVLLDVDSSRCIFFKQVYGLFSEVRAAGDKIISGRFCETASDPNVDMLTAQTFYFLDQLRQNNRKVVQLGDLVPKKRPARIEAEA